MTEASEADERLLRAARDNDVAAAREALAGGARARYIAGATAGADGETTPVLFLACQNKNLEMAALLLEHRADPDTRARREWVIPDADKWEITCWSRETCLQAAMPALDLVELLLVKGADPNRPSEQQVYSLERTHILDVAKGNEALTALLERHGADRRKMPPTKEEYDRKQRLASRRQRPKKKKAR
jgi:hypothetical protein